MKSLNISPSVSLSLSLSFSLSRFKKTPSLPYNLCEIICIYCQIQTERWVGWQQWQWSGSIIEWTQRGGGRVVSIIQHDGWPPWWTHPNLHNTHHHQRNAINEAQTVIIWGDSWHACWVSRDVGGPVWPSYCKVGSDSKVSIFGTAEMFGYRRYSGLLFLTSTQVKSRWRWWDDDLTSIHMMYFSSFQTSHSVHVIQMENVLICSN